MSDVISLDDFRKSAKELKQPVDEESPFAPETQSDAATGNIIDSVYAAMNNLGVDNLSDESQELYTAMYDLVRAMTDRHFNVENELNMTRDIQVKHGEPFYLIGVATMDKEQDNG